eukprot:m.4327 g.4327  ORF g.4327 m.4327 type:complete len:76 (-) comp6874_c0_seq1:232-459(-)
MRSYVLTCTTATPTNDGELCDQLNHKEAELEALQHAYQAGFAAREYQPSLNIASFIALQQELETKAADASTPDSM